MLSSTEHVQFTWDSEMANVSITYLEQKYCEINVCLSEWPKQKQAKGHKCFWNMMLKINAREKWRCSISVNMHFKRSFWFLWTTDNRRFQNYFEASA